ncbi:MAG: sulfide/dihydroorotate dehydrogenase-like FAD/NAD-binding protein [Oscillospiraceae bacterium]|jgi:ferredoxin--NADP+ reductase|nr:sulfide/dihydroorotate dehydrogenase-like FAD/NAD-binding protein [Oscillospiraceae bacterium]
MYRIVEARRYNSQVKRLTVEAPRVAARARPGQFVMVRVDERGERIPLTIADSDAASGRVTIIFQEVGRSTAMLGALEEGGVIADIVGPLGVPSHLEGLKRVCVVGGGLGCAIAYPQAKALFGMGAHVEIVAGFRNASLVFLEEEMRAVSHKLTVCTDDGSNGCKGLVTDILKASLEAGAAYDAVIAIGPLLMMKFVCLTTKPYAVPTVVSMNPIMVDGTGMCGCCRVTVGGAVKFACVDGPDFDGHLVDFDEAARRNTIYRAQEQQSLQDHICRGEERLHAQ